MFKSQLSISKKITFAYYVFVAIVIGISLFTFMELRYVEKITFGEVISEFLNTTLEIRRFEKNYFLYGQESDYREAARYVALARKSLETHLKEFTAVAGETEITMLLDSIEKYGRLLEDFSGTTERTPGEIRRSLENNIRKTGKEITNIAEGISRMERRNLQVIISNSQRLLIFSVATLILLGIVIGQFLSRLVVKPLKQLTVSMEAIVDGSFENVRIESKDREIVSLAHAFNKMFRELELRQRHLIQSEKLASLGTLLSGVAHELNNPLSNISSSGQILSEEIEDNDLEYKRELVAQINDQTDRARNIVRSLLEFSREKDFRKESVNLGKLVGETIGFIRGQVPAKVEISLDIPGDIEIFADKQRIQQVFLNLIKNAVEAIGEEGRVSVTARRQRAVDKVGEDDTGIYNYLKYRGKCTLEEDTVDIKVSDTGGGIPEEILSKIFDPFFTTKDVGKGSGLGLFIVHEIIEEHDGCIAVDSEKGKGTTFLIRIPVKSK